MNASNLVLKGDAVLTVITGLQITDRINAKYICEETLFVALSTVKSSYFHEYLIRRGLSDSQINSNGVKFLNNHKEKLGEFRKCVDIHLLVKPSNGVETMQIARLPYELWNGLSEMCISSKSGKEIAITSTDILKFFIVNHQKLYEEYMDMCFPGSKTSKEVFIPAGLQGILKVMNDMYSEKDTKCPILGRDKEVKTLVNILAKAKKRNAILIGEPGVGKTALVEKLVWMIVTGNCHERFKDYVVVSLDVTSIIAGTKYRGTAEARFNELISFLENNPKCILFIDEIHTVLGAGACTEGELDLANSLKPILARSDTQVIGATTEDEYKKYFSKDGALKRRFERIYVREPRSHEVYPMIKNQIDILGKAHGVTISRKMIDVAILNASCFNYETRNPDRTLDLIDRSMASAELCGHKKVSKADILGNFEIHTEQFTNSSEAQKKRIAYHEAGHFIVRRYSPELIDMKTLAISIMPAEGYYGVNVLEDVDTILYDNYAYYIQKIAALLGGRVAEMMYTSELSAGARSDLRKANEIAENMVTSFGLAKEYSSVRVYSLKEISTDDIINKIDRVVKEILEEARKHAENVLIKHNKELEIIVQALMERGIINQNEIDALLEDY